MSSFFSRNRGTARTRRTVSGRTLFLFVLGLFVTHAARAQCCSPGNPIGGQGNQGVLPEGAFNIFANYVYSYSGSYYEGSRPTTSSFVDSGRYNHLSVSMAYGLSDRLTLGGEASYFIDKVQNYVDGIRPGSRKGFGLGDVSFLVEYNLYRSRPVRWEITSGLGIKYPLGGHRQKTEGALLPLDVQTTTGAVDFFHTLFLYRFFPRQGLRVFLTNRIEWKGTNSEGYRYGNLYAPSLFASYHLGLRWDAILQLRSEIRAKDRRPSGQIPVTGSTKIFITPQLSYTLGSTTGVSLLVDFPVYQYYNEEQLANTVGVGISLMKRIIPDRPGEILAGAGP